MFHKLFEFHTNYFLLILCCRPHVVALILARGGSKGIPRKNLAIIQNTTLLRRSLDTINDCGCMINMIIDYFIKWF